MDPILLRRLKITGITIGIIVGILLIAIFTICIIDTISYSKYNNKLKEWGFENAYTLDTFIYGFVSNGEAITTIVNVLDDPLNTKSFGYKQDINSIHGKFVKFASVNKIIAQDEITDKNIESAIKKEKFNEYLNNALKELLNKQDNLNIDELVSNDRSIFSYLTGNILRRDLNILIVKLAEKYSLIDIEKRPLNETNLPSNFEDYPYVTSSILNEVYQIPYIVDNNKISEFKKPKQLFDLYKSTYMQIKERIEKYYSIVLNVDYSTIDKNTFINSIEELMQFKGAEKRYNDYIDYVKENKIVLKGKAEALIPILYYDGSTFRVRTKLEFTATGVKKENLIFGDTNNNLVQYTDNSYSIYVDTPLEQSLITNSLYITVHSPLLNIAK